MMVDGQAVEEDYTANKIKQVGKIRIVTGKSLVRSRVVFSKDVKHLFCGYGSNIRVHNVKTGDIVSVFKGHTGEVSDLCLSTKNTLQLLSCCLDGYVNWWDILDGTIISQLRCVDPLYGITVHKDHPNIVFLVNENRAENGKRKFLLCKAHIENKKNLSDLKCKKLCDIDKAVGSYSFSSQGQYVASVCGNSLQLWNFQTKKLKKYASKGVTCVAFHPVELCVATGNTTGVITIWRNLGFESSPVCTKLHWHAHSVETIAFSFDGSYLYSGAEEAVLVFWQFETGHKQFKPRLGSPIAHICSSPDDTVIAMLEWQQNNQAFNGYHEMKSRLKQAEEVFHNWNLVINLVSAVDLSVVNVVQGLTKANQVYTGLVADPLTNALVLNSQVGNLQFYRPDADSLAFTLNIVSQNYISRTDKKPLQMTRVEQVSFSPSGDWLATVEGRNDGETTPEIRLKFWKYEKESQRHVLNTCIDPPHDATVVSVEFQPGEFNEIRAMSASVDGKFKIWKLSEQQVIKGFRHVWQCQSVGYFKDEPVTTAKFSSDGSLLAVAYGEAVTLWDPCTNELKTTLYSPFSETINIIEFGRRSCAHMLLVSTKHNHLIAWNLLSCSIIWSVEAEVNSLLSDPLTHLIVAFVIIDKLYHGYIFDPRAAVPVCIIPNVIKNGCFATSCFQPNIKGLEINQASSESLTMAKLFIMNEKQVLFTVDEKDVDPEDAYLKKNSGIQTSEFHRMFEEYTSDSRATAVSKPQLSQHKESSFTVLKEMLNVPSHVLPPTTTLCSTLLSSLLINKKSNSEPLQGAEDDDDGKDINESLGSVTSDDDGDERLMDVSEQEMKETNLEEREDDAENELISKSVDQSNFEWMKDFFDSLK